MTVRLVCLGDVMLARGVSHILVDAEPASLWGDLHPLLAEGDIRLANLECCISERGRPFEPPRVFSFRAIPKAMDVLKAAGIDVVTLANNHSLDWGEEALLDTLDRLDSAGIGWVGAGRTLEEASRPCMVAAGGSKIGVVAFADHYPEYAADSGKAGTFVVEIGPNGVTEVQHAVRAARNRGADLVVVTAHWGPNMRTHPPEQFRRFARSILDAGADLWFGHSAHVFQGVEFYRDRPIIYDGGDFLDDYAVDRHLRNDRSLLWRIGWNEGPPLVEAFPVELSFARTSRASPQAFEWIAERLAGLSEQMGSTLDRLEDRLVLRPS